MLIAQLSITDEAFRAFEKGRKTQLSRVAEFHAANGHEDLAEGITAAQHITLSK
jgi:hypothetical protein